MGIFGSSTKTTVGTTVTRVIEDGSLPGAVLAGATRDLFSDDGGQLIECIMEELVGGIGLRANRMHEYGRKSYTHGLPMSSLHNANEARNALENIIEAEVGGNISLLYYRFGPLNNLHVGRSLLIEDLELIEATGELVALSEQKGFPVYLTELRLVLTSATLADLENGTLEQWGEQLDHPFVLDPAATSDCLKVLYHWTEVIEHPAEVTPAWTETIRHPAEGSNSAWTETIEHPAVETEPAWTERIEHRDPEVDVTTLTLPLANPDADFHQAKFTIGGTVGYWSYEHGSGMYPALDSAYTVAYSTLGNFFPFAYFRYNKQPTNLNKFTPEYHTTKKLLNYLNMEFDKIADAIHDNPDIKDVEQAILMMGVPANTTDPMERRYLFDFFSGLAGTTSPAGTLIQDRKFKMALSYRSALRQRYNGSIGEVDSHTSGMAHRSDVVTGVDTSGQPVSWSSGVATHWYRRQINATQYDEIRVEGLRMTYHIFEQYTTTGDEDDKILLIPIDRSITDAYTLPKREVLYARSLHYVFNSRVVTKLKWYQTGIFKVVVIIIAVVAAVFTYGTSLKAAGALIAAGAYAAAAAILIGIAIEYLIMSLAVKLFVKVVGAKIAFIAAIVAAVYGGYITYDAGSVAGAPFAQELLSISTSLANKSIEVHLKEEYRDLLVEADLLRTEQDAKLEKLHKAEDLLNSTNSHLAPMVIFGESPDDFYQRTVHSGNIGMVGIEAITSYVDMQLTLPKISTTLGEFV